MKSAANSYFPEELSALITVGLFGILGWMMHDRTAIDNEPLLIMLGSLGAAFDAHPYALIGFRIVAFYVW